MKSIFASLLKLYAVFATINLANTVFAQDHVNLHVTPMRIATSEIALQVRLSQQEIESIREQTRHYVDNQEIEDGSKVDIYFRISNANTEDMQTLLANEALGSRRFSPINPYFEPLWTVTRSVIDETTPHILVNTNSGSTLKELIVVIDDKKNVSVAEANRNADYTLSRIRDLIAQRPNTEVSIDLSGGLASKLLLQKLLQLEDQAQSRRLIDRVRVLLYTKTNGAPDALSKWEFAFDKFHERTKRQILLSDVYFNHLIKSKFVQSLELTICAQSAF